MTPQKRYDTTSHTQTYTRFPCVSAQRDAVVSLAAGSKWETLPPSPTSPTAVEDAEKQPPSEDDDPRAIFYVSSVALAGADSGALVANFSALHSVCVKWLDKHSALLWLPEVSLAEAMAALSSRRLSIGGAPLGLVTLAVRAPCSPPLGLPAQTPTHLRTHTDTHRNAYTSTPTHPHAPARQTHRRPSHTATRSQLNTLEIMCLTRR